MCRGDCNVYNRLALIWYQEKTEQVHTVELLFDNISLPDNLL